MNANEMIGYLITAIGGILSVGVIIVKPILQVVKIMTELNESIKALTDKNKLAKSVKPRTKSIDLLNQYTAKIKPVMEKGGIAAAAEVAKSNSNIHIKTDPHDINLNGTLNIKGENGQTIDLMKELNNNPRLMRQLADMLTNEMGVLKKGGYVAQGV